MALNARGSALAGQRNAIVVGHNLDVVLHATPTTELRFISVMPIATGMEQRTYPIASFTRTCGQSFCVDFSFPPLFPGRRGRSVPRPERALIRGTSMACSGI